MHSEEMKEEMKLLSLKHNVTLEQLRELVYLIFKFIREKIKSADRFIEKYPAIRLMGIGIFYVTKNRQKKLKQSIQNDEDNNIGPEEQ